MSACSKLSSRLNSFFFFSSSSFLTTITFIRLVLHRRYYEYHILGKFQAAAVEHAENVE